MNDLFLTVVSMSFTASFVILFLYLLRFCLQNKPKKYSYALWSIAAIRLLCPISLPSPWSLFNLRLGWKEVGELSLNRVPTAVQNFAATAPVRLPSDLLTEESSPAADFLRVGAILWILGIGMILLFGVLAYIKLRHRVRFATRLRDNIWQSEEIRSPFLLGIFLPKIYLPYGLSPEAQEAILLHENSHIKRWDHVIRPLSYLILSIHWFNPLCWAAFSSMCKDMEMSCDERILTKQESLRKTYSNTLLSFAHPKRFPTPGTLLFGENTVGKRIKNILNWRKPTRWISVVLSVLCLAGALFALSDPIYASTEGTFRVTEILYTNGSYSFVPTVSILNPTFYIREGDQLHLMTRDPDGTGHLDPPTLLLGELEEVELTRYNFDKRFVNLDLWFREGFSGETLRERNHKAWYIYSEADGLQRFYYFLQQKNGDILLVDGFEPEPPPEGISSAIIDNAEGTWKDLVRNVYLLEKTQ